MPTPNQVIYPNGAQPPQGQPAPQPALGQAPPQEEPKQNPLTPLILKESADYANTLWANVQEATMVFRNRLNDFYKQYRGIPGRKNYEGLANVFVNETLEACESISAQEVQTIFAEPNNVMIVGRERTDETKAKLIESLMRYYFERSGFKSKLIRQVRQKNKYGTNIAKICWTYEEKNMTQRTQNGIEQNKKVVRDFPDLEYIDLLDIAVDPGKSDIEKMDWVIWRKRVTWDYIKERERRGLYSSDQVKKMDKSAKKEYNYLGNKNQRMQSMGINYSSMDMQEYEILEFWGKVPIWWVDDNIDPHSPEAEEMVEAVMEVAIKGVTLRLERNPYWHQEKPFAMGHFIQVDDEAFGMGVCEISEYLQMELNDKRNQLLDHATEQIAPPLIKNRNANIDKKQIKLSPFAIIDSDLPGDAALTPLRLGGNPLENVQMDSIIKQDIRNQTGATNPVQGVPTGKDQTAFEISTLQSRGSARINISTIDFSEKFLKRTYKLMFAMVQQYMTQEKAVRIVGKDGIKWETVTPEDVMMDVDLIPKVSTDLDNRSIMRNQMIQFITGIAQFYPRINIFKLVRKVYELFGFEDAEEVVPEPDTERGIHELTIEQEIQVMTMGQKIEPNFWEDHLSKIQAFMQFLTKNQQALSPQAQEAFKDNIAMHTKYLQILEQIKAQMGQGGAPAQAGQPAQAPAGSPQAQTPVAQHSGAARNLTGGQP